MDFGVGTRAQVLRDPAFGPAPWPSEPMGTVSGEPQVVQGRDGDLVSYWVLFDEPQFDADGSGPYSSSQVLGKYLGQEPNE